MELGGLIINESINEMRKNQNYTSNDQLCYRKARKA